jgi:hypothetical protein
MVLLTCVITCERDLQPQWLGQKRQAVSRQQALVLVQLAISVLCAISISPFECPVSLGALRAEERQCLQAVPSLGVQS